MRAHLRTLAILALTIGLLAWFLRNANLAAVGSEIRHGNWALLGAALAVQAAQWFFRAFRWRYLLRPLGPVTLRSAFECTMIGFAALALLPARAGEIIRPYLLARREHLSASAAFATIVLERLLDLLTVLMLFAAVVLTTAPPEGAANPTLYRAMQTGGALLGAGAVAGLVVFFVLASHPERIGSYVQRLSRVLPHRIADALARAASKFATGLAIVRQPRRLAVALLLSFPLWLSIAVAIWWGSHAFRIALPFAGSLVVMALLVVGVAVPTPGGVGGYHEAFRIGATALYGAANDQAISAAIVMHAISFIPISLAGLMFMAREGLNLGRVRDLARAPEDRENVS